MGRCLSRHQRRPFCWSTGEPAFSKRDEAISMSEVASLKGGPVIQRKALKGAEPEFYIPRPLRFSQSLSDDRACYSGSRRHDARRDTSRSDSARCHSTLPLRITDQARRKWAGARTAIPAGRLTEFPNRHWSDQIPVQIDGLRPLLPRTTIKGCGMVRDGSRVSQGQLQRYASFDH
jgi:hypothetical protein